LPELKKQQKEGGAVQRRRLRKCERKGQASKAEMYWELAMNGSQAKAKE